MGDFTFNYIFLKVINSSTKANTNCQVLACQAWCHVTPHKKPHLLPCQIQGAQLVPHSLLPSWCSSGADSQPLCFRNGGCSPFNPLEISPGTKKEKGKHMLLSNCQTWSGKVESLGACSHWLYHQSSSCLSCSQLFKRTTTLYDIFRKLSSQTPRGEVTSPSLSSCNPKALISLYMNLRSHFIVPIHPCFWMQQLQVTCSEVQQGMNLSLLTSQQLVQLSLSSCPYDTWKCS